MSPNTAGDDVVEGRRLSGDQSFSSLRHGGGFADRCVSSVAGIPAQGNRNIGRNLVGNFPRGACPVHVSLSTVHVSDPLTIKMSALLLPICSV